MSISQKYILKSKKKIEQLYSSKSSFFVYPFYVSFLIEDKSIEDKYSLMFVFSVPKRKIKSAVQRNRIKRVIKEICRKRKDLLEGKLNRYGKKMFIFLSYTEKEELPGELISNRIKKIFYKLEKKIQSDED